MVLQDGFFVVVVTSCKVKVEWLEGSSSHTRLRRRGADDEGSDVVSASSLLHRAHLLPDQDVTEQITMVDSEDSPFRPHFNQTNDSAAIDWKMSYLK